MSWVPKWPGWKRVSRTVVLWLLSNIVFTVGSGFVGGFIGAVLAALLDVSGWMWVLLVLGVGLLAAGVGGAVIQPRLVPPPVAPRAPTPQLRQSAASGEPTPPTTPTPPVPSGDDADNDADTPSGRVRPAAVQRALDRMVEVRNRRPDISATQPSAPMSTDSEVDAAIAQAEAILSREPQPLSDFRLRLPFGSSRPTDPKTAQLDDAIAQADKIIKRLRRRS